MGQKSRRFGVAVGKRSLGSHSLIGLLLLGPVVTLLALHMSARTGWLNADRSEGPPTTPTQATAAKPSPSPPLFRDWPSARPDLVLVLTAQQHGFLDPCGCSRPQYGGLQRRHNFIQDLRQRGWPVAAVDLGDIIDPPSHRGPQTLLKYQTSMKALRQMGYLAVGLGQYETEMPLIDTLAQYALNFTAPRILAANLKDKDNNFPGMLASWTAATPPGSSVKVGVAGIVGPSVRDKVPAQNPALMFADTVATLKECLKEMKAEKPDVRILLYQGSAREAGECAKYFPDFNVVLCLTEQSEPPNKPHVVGNSWVISTGHKGRYVGVVGFWKTGKADPPLDRKYQLVMLSEDYETKPGQEKDNPVLQILEDYTKQVQDGNYLARYPQRKHPVQLQFPKAEYVGSAECKTCHRYAYQVWKDHPHSHAYQTLENAKRPSLRQFDGECVVCHTVGFGYETGFVTDQKTPDLKDVGCESCHGPGSLHAQLGKKTPPAMLTLMNPFKPQPNETAEQEAKRLLALDLSCQKCHDVDNDVHWNFKKKWPAVIHRTPKEEGEAKVKPAN